MMGQISPAASLSDGFTCTACGRQYQRSSHLRRHELTHAETTGFHCPFCDKLFARRDVCRKHALHCPSKGARDDPPLARRGQKPRACDGCFRSRLACDNELPCSRCVARQAECSYERLAQRDQRGGGPQGSISGGRRSPGRHIKREGSEDDAHQPQQLPSPSVSAASRNSICEVAADHRASSTTPSSPIGGGDERIVASFLLSLTNPKAETMIGAFVKESGRDDDPADDDVVGGAQNLRPPDADDMEGVLPDFVDGIVTGRIFPWSAWSVGGTLPMDLDMDDFGASPVQDFSPIRASDTRGAVVVTPSSTFHPAADSPGLEAAAAAVIQALQETHDRLVLTEPSYDGTFDRALADQVFVPANLRAFVSGYFRHTNPDFPIIHPPSFSTELAAPELVLALFLCGSLYAPPTDSALSTRGFFHLAEELAFRRLSETMAAVAAGGGGDRGRSGKRGMGAFEGDTKMLETLQGALIIHCMQFTMSSVTTRRRNRTLRLPALVSAVRMLGITTMRHREYSPESPASQWEQFAQTEGWIRVATWTVLANWQQSGMFHFPPLMTILEMTADLPCFDDLWDAGNAADFEAAVRARGGVDCMRRKGSLRVAVEAIMGDAWAGAEAFPVPQVTLQDMSLLVFALHATILTARFMSLLPSSGPAILRATSRWQELWDVAARGVGSEELSRKGLIRHSTELCWLARKKVEAFVFGVADDSGYLDGVAHDSLEQLHSFLRRYCRTA